jgi:TonB family protein
MMNKNKTPWLLSTKYLLIVPVGFALVLGNAIQASPDPLETLPDVIAASSAGTDGVSGATIDPQQTVKATDEKPYIIVEQMPAFPGGMPALKKYISTNLKYPKEAQEKKQQGRVIVRFIVAKNGTVKDAEVKHSLSPEMDAEALRVINSMPKWTPGKHKGQFVDVYWTMPVVFMLQE